MKYIIVIISAIIPHYIHIPHIDGDEFYQYYVAQDSIGHHRIILSDQFIKPGDTAVIEMVRWEQAKDTNLKTIKP